MLQESPVDGEDADPVVVVVGDVDVLVLVAAHAIGNFELSVPAAVPSDRVQVVSVGREHLDTVTAGVRHDHLAAASDTDVAGEGELERLPVAVVVRGVLFRACLRVCGSCQLCCGIAGVRVLGCCLLYTSPSPRDRL